MRIYAEKLNLLIEQSGLTQTQFAEKMGILQSALNNYVTDKREPKLSIAKKIADYFGVSVDYMVRSDEEISVRPDNKWKSNLMNKFSRVV